MPEPKMAAEISALKARVAELERQLAEADAVIADHWGALGEVDEVISTYGIDPVGTGYGPTKKEEARIQAIVEAATERAEKRRTAPQKDASDAS